MPLICLKEGVVMHLIDGNEGKLLLSSTGECFSLDPVATVLLRIALQVETLDEAEQSLALHLDAGNDQIREGLASLIEQLTVSGLLLAHPTLHSGLVPAYAEVGSYRSAASQGTQARRLGALPQITRNTAWDVFLTGKRDYTPLPALPPFLRMAAYGQAIRILLLLGWFRVFPWLLSSFRLKRWAKRVQQREWSALSYHLSTIPTLPSTQHGLSEEASSRLARRELAPCQLITRLLAPTSMCLVRSAPFCAYLRTLGLPAQMIVAQPCFGSVDGYPFHAWVEVEGVVVNDLAEVQSGYTELQRIPKHA